MSFSLIPASPQRRSPPMVRVLRLSRPKSQQTLAATREERDLWLRGDRARPSTLGQCTPPRSFPTPEGLSYHALQRKSIAHLYKLLYAFAKIGGQRRQSHRNPRWGGTPGAELVIYQSWFNPEAVRRSTYISDPWGVTWPLYGMVSNQDGGTDGCSTTHINP